MSQSSLRSIVLGALLFLATGCGVGMADADVSEDQLSDEASLALSDAIPFGSPEAAPGRVMVKDGAGGVVPPRGQTVVGVIELEGGGSRRVTIATDDQGHVTATDELELPPGATGAEVGGVQQGLSAACSDGAYSHEGFKWNSTYTWYFRADSTPTENSIANVEQSLREGANNITGAHNDCGLADAVSATNSYAGRTTTASNISSTTTSVTCGSTDGKNVVVFGTLPKGYLGITCYWYSNGVGVGADVKLNKYYYHWFAGNTVPSGCSSRFSVESVATHEFGHAFGLGHVSETDHATLTMSTALPPCNNSASTLGLGDVRSLNTLY